MNVTSESKDTEVDEVENIANLSDINTQITPVTTTTFDLEEIELLEQQDEAEAVLNDVQNEDVFDCNDGCKLVTKKQQSLSQYVFENFLICVPL